MEIKEYLQKMLDRWNKYDELDGFVAENFRVDLEKTLEYWDLRIADNKEELDKAREEVQFTKEELECILKWKDACDGEFNGMTLLPASGEDWGKEEDIENAEDKLEEMLSKLKDNK